MNRNAVDLMPYNAGMWLVSTPFIVQQTTSLPQMASVPQPVQSSTTQALLNKEHSIQLQSNDMTQFQAALKSYNSKSPTLPLSPKTKANVFPQFSPTSGLRAGDQRSPTIKQEFISGVSSNGTESEMFQGSPVLSKTVCKTCGKWFRSRQQLTQHQLVHTDIRKYRCNFCDRAFKQPSHLQQHHRIHTGEKPYRCPLEGCTRAFPQLSNLNHHLRNHDKPDPPTENTCRFCGRTYASEAVLKNHMLKIHLFNGDAPFGEMSQTTSGELPSISDAGGIKHLHNVTKSMLMKEHNQYLTSNGQLSEEMIKNMQNAFQIFNIPHKKMRFSEEDIDRGISREDKYRREFLSDVASESSEERKTVMQPPLLMHAMSPEAFLQSDTDSRLKRRKGAPPKLEPGNDITDNGVCGKIDINDHLHEICVRENYNYTLDTTDKGVRVKNVANYDKELAGPQSIKIDSKPGGVNHDAFDFKSEFVRFNDRDMTNTAYRHANEKSSRDDKEFDSVRYVKDNLHKYVSMARNVNGSNSHHDSERSILIERSRNGIDLDMDSNAGSDCDVHSIGISQEEKEKNHVIENHNQLYVQISNSRKRKAFQPQRVVYDQEALDFSA